MKDESEEVIFVTVFVVFIEVIFGVSSVFVDGNIEIKTFKQ